MSKYLIGSIVTVVIIAALAGAYFLGKGQLSVNKPTPTPQATTVSQTTAQSAPGPSPSPDSAQKEELMVNPSVTIDAFQNAVKTGNYAVLPQYMAGTVNVIIYASSCCGDYTKTQTIQEMSGYLKNAQGPWDFSPQDGNSQIMVQKLPQYFKDYVIGVATGSHHVAAVHLNDKFLIDRVTLVVDYELITK